jgi:hypothetical protein
VPFTYARTAAVLADSRSRYAPFVIKEEFGFVSPIGMSGRLNLFAALALGRFA